MSYFPNCREDEYYNQKYLNEKDKEFIAGADWILEQIVNMIENNADVYPDLEQLLDDNTAIIKEDKDKIVSEAVQDWAEMERNMMITSMIDNYEDFDEIKAKVDANENV